jgi:hypothetical protein
MRTTVGVSPVGHRQHIPVFVIEDDEPVRLPDGPLLEEEGRREESANLISAPAERKRGFRLLCFLCERCWRRADVDDG